jgi:hypothetical protein
MDEIRTARRRSVRFLPLALMLLLAACFVAPHAFAQTPPSPAAPAPAPASPAPAPAPPAPAPAPPAAPPPVAAPAAAPVPPPPPTKEQLAEAKKFFEAGLRLKKEGLYQEALASFLEANRIAPRESIQNNLALTYRLMKEMASAYDSYEVLLSKYGDKMKPQLKDEAQKAIEALEVLTGVIVVGVQEPGAKVLIDNKDLGPTPLAKPVRLNIGMHQVSITKDGFDPLVQTVEIHGHDSVPINGPLVKTVLTGHVVVDVKQTTPPDPTVLIYVDATDAGAPPYTADLDPGMHTFEAKGDKAIAPAKQIQVEKKGTYNELLELHVQAGTIVVNVDVADSEIAIDGTLVARGVYEGPTPAGTHALTVTKAGYTQYKKDLIVHDGDRIVENVALPKEAQSAAAPPPPEWSGVYSHLEFLAQFEVTKPTNDIAQGVGYTNNTQIDGSSIFGGGLDVRVGYSLGFIGIEGTVILGYDHSSANVTLNEGQATITHPGPTPRTEDYEFNRLGGTATLGVRLMPKTQVIRPTLGIGGGISLKGIFYSRNIQSQASAASGNFNEPSNPAFYPAPSLVIDGGIELGSTPGTKFYLGCLMVADFSSATPINTTVKDPNYPSPPNGLNGVNGTDIFIGPIIGMQFGK